MTGDPVVLVIGAGLQHRRQQRFVEIVAEEAPTAHIIVRENSEFARMRAREIAEGHLRATGQAPAIIFCTSDELALGAVDLLERMINGEQVRVRNLLDAKVYDAKDSTA
jgi:DNA-binding LacI/PurR family transcriptional regulator